MELGSRIYSYTYSSSKSVGRIELGSATIVVGPCDTVDTYVDVVISLNGSRGSVLSKIEDFSVEPLEHLKFAVKAAARIARKKTAVGICCSGGCGRTGTATVLLLMAYYNMSLTEALRKFYDARGCGPESDSQKLLLAYAELLRRRGLTGDALIDALEIPPTTIRITDKIVAADVSRIRIDDIEIDVNLIDTLDDLIRDMVKNAREIVVPLDVDVIKKIASSVPEEVLRKIEDVKKLWSVWTEAYSTASMVARKWEKKKAKKKDLYAEYYEDYD